jgi:hypothetical protein
MKTFSFHLRGLTPSLRAKVFSSGNSHPCPKGNRVKLLLLCGCILVIKQEEATFFGMDDKAVMDADHPLTEANDILRRVRE